MSHGKPSVPGAFVTKGGGQEFHGDVFHFFRNSALDANSWTRNKSSDPTINSKPAPFTFNQFGFDLGGPVYIPGKFNEGRNKLFFFWAEEWIRWRRAGTNTGPVPPAKMRNDDFSELLGPNSFFSGPRYIRDPLKTGNCNATDQTACFSGNIIPANRLSANGIGLLKSFPLPTPGFQSGRANWIGTSPNPRDTRKDTLRIDFHPSARNQFSLRGANFSGVAVDSFRGTFDLARTDWSRPNRSVLSHRF